MRTRRTRTIVTVLSAGLCLALAACGGGGGSAGAGAGGGAGEPLVVGTDPTHPPHDFLDEKGEIVGWEHDLIMALGEEMGRPVEYQAASFDALLPGLAARRYDLVFANMGITPERLEVVDMVTAFNGGQAFLARADRGLDLSTLDALCGVSVGVSRGSVQADLARQQSETCTEQGRPPVEIKVYQSGDQIVLAVESKRVDSYWTAQPIAQYYATQPGSVLALAGDVPGTKSPTAIALPKGSDLTEPVREALQTLIDDGTYLRILREWKLEANAIETAEVNPEPKR